MESIEPKTTIAVFDLDLTITRNDTYLSFIKATLTRRPSRWIPAALLPLSYMLFLLGMRDNHWLKQRFLKAVAGGLSEADLEKICRPLVKRILRKDVRPKALLALEEHRQKGDFLILATASFGFYVHAIGSALGFDQVVCTEAEKDEMGLLTGNIDGLNCYGEEKLRRTAELVNGKVAAERIVYTDHHSDLPLVKWADQVRLVRPGAKLTSQVQGLRYEVCDW